MTDLQNIKGIIFDFDGTLFDLKHFAFRLIFANPFDLRFIRNERIVRKSFSGKDYLSSHEYYKAFFIELAKACKRPSDVMRNWYFYRYMPRMVKVLKKHYRPRKGAKELLQYLGGGNCPVKTAVYSDYLLLKERMEAIGLIFQEGISLFDPASFGAQKPAVRPFLEIAKEFNLLPKDVLVIGDREDTDGQGAKNASMQFFHVKKDNWQSLLDCFNLPQQDKNCS